MWWVIYSSIVLGVGIGVLAQPQLAVRFMTVKSDKELNRSIAVGGVFILVCVATAFVVGALSNVYFQQNAGKIAVAMAEGNTDRVIPVYLDAAMPAWFSVVFILVILSAAMSTLSSQFHAIGTAISRDIIEQGILKGRNVKTTTRGSDFQAWCSAVFAGHHTAGHEDGRRRHRPGYGDFLRPDGVLLPGSLHGRHLLEADYPSRRHRRDFVRIPGVCIRIPLPPCQ
jgi:Na+(H+)/acetate symporter ActP